MVVVQAATDTVCFLAGRHNSPSHLYKTIVNLIVQL